MNHITIGVFHDEALAAILGKKSSTSDLLLYHRKTDDCIYTFVCPRDDKLQTKTQIMSMIDAAVISPDTITSAVGETILLLDIFNISTGVCIAPPFSETEMYLQRFSKNTTVESYHFTHEKTLEILEHLPNTLQAKNTKTAVQVIVDHAFPVKGVGEICLGFITQGVLHRHDKLRLYPTDKEIVIRSIQMQDEDVDEASAGCRVGLAIKGASWDEMNRGSILAEQGSIQFGTTVQLAFEKTLFYPKTLEINQVAHFTLGLQTQPVTITEINDKQMVITLEKPIVYQSGCTGVLLDLNAEKLHLIGKGTVL